MPYSDRATVCHPKTVFFFIGIIEISAADQRRRSLLAVLAMAGLNAANEPK